ncbi:hypothetical protein JHK84_040078 [Glycine max]|nr:hypothetical protein JHK85_040447 [Glycine max]KAG5121738.1 hypothetical protein JHK84_040078 [Glycine max]
MAPAFASRNLPRALWSFKNETSQSINGSTNTIAQSSVPNRGSKDHTVSSSALANVDMRLTRRGMKEPPSSHNQSKDHQTLTLNHIPLLMGLWRKKLSPRWKMLTIDCYDGLLDLDEHVD